MAESRIRAARPEEAPLLGALARRSKGYWGYSRAFLDACRDELTVTPALLGTTFVLELDGRVVGFHALAPEATPDGERELEHLFVEPAVIGRGHGRELMEHAKGQARAAGNRAIRVQSDPHAAAFYRAAGGRVVGEQPSASIPGRVLPVLMIDVGG